MSPEFLPEFALLIAAGIVGALALNRLVARRWGRAASLGAASLAMVALALVGGKHRDWQYVKSWHLQPKRHVLVPASPAEPAAKDPGEPSTMSLLLGGVPVHVVVSERWELSVNNETFLTLDSLSSGLLVSCDVAGSDTPPIRAPRRAAQISENVVLRAGPDVRPARPDGHTIQVEEAGNEVLKVHYANPRRIEVAGQFYLSGDGEPSAISLTEGIRWRGGFVGPGAGIDLRPQGKGRINFESSGLIRILSD